MSNSTICNKCNKIKREQEFTGPRSTEWKKYDWTKVDIVKAQYKFYLKAIKYVFKQAVPEYDGAVLETPIEGTTNMLLLLIDIVNDLYKQNDDKAYNELIILLQKIKEVHNPNKPAKILGVETLSRKIVPSGPIIKNKRGVESILRELYLRHRISVKEKTMLTTLSGLHTKCTSIIVTLQNNTKIDPVVFVDSISLSSDLLENNEAGLLQELITILTDLSVNNAGTTKVTEAIKAIRLKFDLKYPENK